ncbi:hypothetical protein [Streptomyces sp. bgisy082]|uniref:hypothetical protein n=1 Tax=Streptomyces sp. bgisy082 TaxID=3413776 RepID=UPI003D709D54
MAEQQDGGDRDPQPIDEEAAWAAIVAGYGEEPADPPGTRPYRPIENLSLPEPEDLDGDEDDGFRKRKTGDAPEAAGKPDLVWKPKADGGPGASGTSGDSKASGVAGGSGAAGDSGTSGVSGTSGASGNSGAAGSSGAEKEPGDGEEPEVEADGAGPEKPVLGGSIVFAPGVRPAGPRDYSPAEPEDGPEGSDEGHFVPPEPPPLPEADTTAKFAWLGVIGGPVLLLVAVLLQWDMTWWLTTLCVGGFLGGFATLVARMKPDDDDDGFDDPGRGAVV